MTHRMFPFSLFNNNLSQKTQTPTHHPTTTTHTHHQPRTHPPVVQGLLLGEEASFEVGLASCGWLACGRLQWLAACRT
jgi:hypothetical protein